MMEKQKPGKVLMLPVDAIEPSPYQARTAFDDTEIAALAVSILQNGLLQPISVRRIGIRKYQLIAGERRLRHSGRLERQRERRPGPFGKHPAQPAGPL